MTVPFPVTIYQAVTATSIGPIIERAAAPNPTPADIEQTQSDCTFLDQYRGFLHSDLYTSRHQDIHQIHPRTYDINSQRHAYLDLYLKCTQ